MLPRPVNTTDIFIFLGCVKAFSWSVCQICSFCRLRLRFQVISLMYLFYADTASNKEVEVRVLQLLFLMLTFIIISITKKEKQRYVSFVAFSFSDKNVNVDNTTLVI